MIRDIKGGKMSVCFIVIVSMLLLSTLIVLATDIKTFEGTVSIVDDTAEVFLGIKAEAPITYVIPKKYENELNTGDKVKCRFLIIKYSGLLKYYLIDVKKIG